MKAQWQIATNMCEWLSAGESTLANCYLTCKKICLSTGISPANIIAKNTKPF